MVIVGGVPLEGLILMYETSRKSSALVTYHQIPLLLSLIRFLEGYHNTSVRFGF